MSFEAKYHGKCARCGDHISPGDQVEYQDHYRGDLIHSTQCHQQQPDTDTPARNERLCPKCWTWHAGGCL